MLSKRPRYSRVALVITLTSIIALVVLDYFASAA